MKYERVCKYCGCIDNTITEGKGPHLKGLKCDGCNRHNGWLSKFDIEMMEKNLSLDDLIKGRDQAKRLADEASREGDQGKYFSMLKLATKYDDKIKDFK